MLLAEMKKKLRNDVLLVTSLLFAAALAFVIFIVAGKDGESVSVILNGEEIATYPLSDDISVNIPSDGDSFNLLRIENGEAYIESADCPDQICVHHRKIKRSGESIVCLPNKLVIKVIGEGDSEPDLVS